MEGSGVGPTAAIDSKGLHMRHKLMLVALVVLLIAASLFVGGLPWGGR